MDSYGNPGSQHRCQPVWNSYQNSIYTATAVYPHTMAGVYGYVPGCIDPRLIARVYFTHACSSSSQPLPETDAGGLPALAMVAGGTRGRQKGPRKTGQGRKKLRKPIGRVYFTHPRNYRIVSYRFVCIHTLVTGVVICFHSGYNLSCNVHQTVLEHCVVNL